MKRQGEIGPTYAKGSNCKAGVEPELVLVLGIIWHCFTTTYPSHCDRRKAHPSNVKSSLGQKKFLRCL
jgi:hypothetical protein